MTSNSVAAAGLTLLGAGLAISIDAGTRRALGAPSRSWLTRGTAGLVVVGSGISLVADAARRAAVAQLTARELAPRNARTDPGGPGVSRRNRL